VCADLLDAQSQEAGVSKDLQEAFPDPKVRHLPTRVRFESAIALGGRTSRLALAMTTRSDKLLEMSFATSMGLVSQLVPFRTEASGIVMAISFRG
jgi:hypothetical protein